MLVPFRSFVEFVLICDLICLAIPHERPSPAKVFAGHANVFGDVEPFRHGCEMSQTEQVSQTEQTRPLSPPILRANRFAGMTRMKDELCIIARVSRTIGALRGRAARGAPAA
ncbi:MAG: hypothetical protein CML61_00435 [Rhodobacteraceae bacterium]|nr:hypothetical protein [Paracoccaceae bacterium]